MRSAPSGPGPGARHRRACRVGTAGEASEQVSVHGKPFALSGVRVIDLSWMLASGGAGRFFAAMGAEVIKVEHISRPRCDAVPAAAPVRRGAGPSVMPPRVRCRRRRPRRTLTAVARSWKSTRAR